MWQDKSVSKISRGWVNVFIPCLLLIYFLVGFSRIRTTDWVPFSAWALFVFVPNTPETYSIKIKSTGNKIFNPPVDVFSQESEVRNANDITLFYLVNKLGYNLTKSNQEEVLKNKFLIESNYLKKGMEWVLVRTSYDPIERWQTGKKMETEVEAYHYKALGD